MRGRQSRKPTYFKKGHGGLFKRVKEAPSGPTTRSFWRVNQELQDFVLQNTENGLIVSRDQSGVPQGASLPRSLNGVEMDTTALRPKDCLVPAVPQTPDQPDDSDTYMVLHRGKMFQFWNSAFRDHMAFKGYCKGDLIMDDSLSKKWGLGWELVVKCCRCSFTTKPMKLYTEVLTEARGRKAATVNIGLQVGLSKQGMSNSGMREILAASNIIPPACNSMQKAANKTCRLIRAENEGDMNDLCENIMTMNQAIGKARDHPIPAETDATYNNRISSGVGQTPYQAGTQATLIVAENVTKNKKIIAAQTYSKLCSCPRDEEDVQHTVYCTANLPLDASIGNEGDYVTDAIESINATGVNIGDLTMDGDSTSRAAATRIQQPGGSQVTPQYCTRHLTRTMQRHISRLVFSKTMFTGQRKSDKDRAHRRFSLDVGHRVQAEFSAACAELGENLPALETKLSNVTDAIVDCYRGSCASCNEHSYVCSEDKPFFRNFIDVNPNLCRQREFINPNADDIKKLRKALCIRLGPAAIAKTAKNTTQNKCEASNRGIKKAVPPSLTFKSNYAGRVHSAVHSMNNSTGESIALLCSAVGAPISEVSSVNQSLKKMDKLSKYHQQRKMSIKYKESRRRLRQERYRRYDTIRNAEGYHKDGAIQDVLPVAGTHPHLCDHDYTT